MPVGYIQVKEGKYILTLDNSDMRWVESVTMRLRKLKVHHLPVTSLFKIVNGVNLDCALKGEMPFVSPRIYSLKYGLHLRIVYELFREYRFLSGVTLSNLLLLVDAPPPPTKQALIDYLSQLSDGAPRLQRLPISFLRTLNFLNELIKDGHLFTDGRALYVSSLPYQTLIHLSEDTPLWIYTVPRSHFRKKLRLVTVDEARRLSAKNLALLKGKDAKF